MLVWGLIPGLVWWVEGSGVASATSRVSAVAQMQALVWEVLHSAGAAMTLKKQTNKKNKKKSRSIFLHNFHTYQIRGEWLKP